jgi:hypothetical protein
MKNKIRLDIYPRTIYTDIVSIPEPCRLGFTFHYYNYSDSNLYFRIVGSGPSPWTGSSTDLGLVNSGVNDYTALNQFMSRTKPAAETEEWLTFTLQGFSDAGYTNLVHEFSRAVPVIFLKSDDGTWTVDELDNFDDLSECTDCEPQDGWYVVYEYEGHTADKQYIDIVTDYVLSSSFALKARYQPYYNTSFRERRYRIYKSFTTPNKSEIYAIINVRWDATCSPTGGGACGSMKAASKYMIIKWGDTQLIYIGKPYDTVQQDYFPRDKWLRFVVPLPANETDELRIVVDAAIAADGAGVYGPMWTWLDDIKIISR